MATKPSSYPQWASEDITELKSIGAPLQNLALPNKLEPPEEWKRSGELYEEPLPAEYINYNFNLLDEWIRHLDERFIIGDIHISKTSEDIATIGARLGGTWVDRGTDTLAGQTVNVYEKTA